MNDLKLMHGQYEMDKADEYSCYPSNLFSPLFTIDTCSILVLLYKWKLTELSQ